MPGTSSHIDSNEQLDLAWKFVSETSENIFLTGKAGTGKTTFLKEVTKKCPKNIIVSAPTGVAAINAGGVTLHSLFQLPFHPFLPTRASRDELLAHLRFNRQRQKLLRKLDLLIIDEISMVRCDVVDAIDTVLRSVRRNFNRPFGGVQLLCIGDLHQLPPVVKPNEWDVLREYYPSPFFFDSLVIREQMPVVIELETIYRQKENSFVDLLNNVRNNQMSSGDFQDLHMRFQPGFRPPANENFITLTSHNNQADDINYRELHKLKGEIMKYEAVIEGDFPETSYPAEASLSLKIGAQVMFLKNDIAGRRYFNGKIGVIKSLHSGEVIVTCDGITINVLPEIWRNSRYVLNRNDGKLEQEELGTFTQLPLRLAWAITIHKSQGLTFDKVMIDAASAFSSGQVYVALSRCTRLEGIVLLSKIPPAAIKCNDHVLNHRQSYTANSSLIVRFAEARQIFSKNILTETFGLQATKIAAGELLSSVRNHSGRLNKLATDWSQNLYDRISKDHDTGQKFIRQIEELIETEQPVEENAVLQSRLAAGAAHFSEHMKEYQETVDKHPIVTEHRDTATLINDKLLNISGSIHLQLYYLQACAKVFSVSTFLRHKLDYSAPKFLLSTYAAASTSAEADTENSGLYLELKKWRDSVCQERGVPIYLVANKKSLEQISRYMPLDAMHLQQISGFGKLKTQKFGAEIIEIVERYCQSLNITGNLPIESVPGKEIGKLSKPRKKDDSRSISFQMFEAGKTIEDIAGERNFAKSTIEAHLAHYVEAGEIGIEKLIEPQKLETVKKIVSQYRDSGYKEIFSHLLPGYTYSDIRFTIAHLNHASRKPGKDQ